MKYQANIVKLDRCIIFQPLFVEESFLNKCKECQNIRFKTKNLDVYLYGNPEMFDGYIFLGTKSITNCISRGEAHRFSTKYFSTNDERDKFYKELLLTIKEILKVRFNLTFLLYKNIILYL